MLTPHIFAEPLAASSRRSYVPIRDYALIGDCHGAALVARDGGIDWWCPERFDAEPVLWRLLDAEKAPVFEICPEDDAEVERAYLPDTNILRSVWTARGGRVAVTDFVPVGRAPAATSDDYVTLSAPGWLVRIVEGVAGRMTIRVQYRPAKASFDGAALDELPQSDCAFGAVALYMCGGAPEGVTAANEAIEVAAGERLAFVLAPVSAATAAPAGQAARLLQITSAFWQEWCGRCQYKGPYGGAVRRSALTLKLLTFAPMGAIVAAPTTSLPEEPGGQRNWDYRFSWLRDSAFVLQAFAALGYSGEARRYCQFLRLCCVQTLPELQILYGIRGETELREQRLDHLDGYDGSRPVRIGNAAYRQKQADIYGELADWALLYHALGEPLDTTLTQILRGAADYIAVHWREPDQGIWEMRGEPRHHVHGKLMAWVALDRAIRLLGPNPVWETEREAVLQAVLGPGIDPEGGYFTQAFGFREPDAALLLAPLLDLPVPPDLLARTVDAVERRLREGDYVRRYRTPDGVPGGEGAFLICSFWLVDALLALNRAVEARSLFESLLTKGNDLGLYAEEVCPHDGAFLGNFPQAFTHLALINSAIHLQLYENKGVEALAGTHADRAKRTAAAREAIWQDINGDGSHTNSRASVLDLKSTISPGRPERSVAAYEDAGPVGEPRNRGDADLRAVVNFPSPRGAKTYCCD